MLIAMETELLSSPESSIESLVNRMEQSPEMYSHLQVFLHREREDNINQDYEFLMVTNSTFGKVKVLNLNVEDSCVIVNFLDCVNLQVGNVHIDFNDKSSNVFFICWKDVKSMVYAERNINFNKSELLEFDYS